MEYEIQEITEAHEEEERAKKIIGGSKVLYQKV